MTPERWRCITEVFHLARARDAAARVALLDEVCAGDADLRSEVEALLAADSDARLFGAASVLPVSEAPRLASGTQFGGYRIETLIGAGGMGEVYRAHDTHLDRDVAIKVLSAIMSPDADARLLHEARAAASLNHPHVCTIHEVGESDGYAYIAMELIDGKPLDQLIPAGGFPLEDVLRYGLQIADAITHAHTRGIVHRDLKPANVMIAESGIAKVLDFGLAKFLPLGHQPADGFSVSHTAGLVVGTAGYMSPEQVMGRATDERSDIFSFGALLYEIATGKPCFSGNSPMEVLDAVLHAEPEPATGRDLPLTLSSVIGKALSKEPAQRYQRMSELAEELRRPERRLPRRWATTAPGAMAALVLAGLIWAGIPVMRDLGTWRFNLASEATVAAPGRGTTSPAAYRAITEGRGLYAAARWQAALDAFKRAVDLDPGYAEAWALLGKSYARVAAPSTFAGGQLQELRSLARAAARRAVELDPSSDEGHVALALAHRESAQYEPWRAAARNAISLNPRMPEAYAVLGDSYGETPAWGCPPDGNIDLAISLYRKAVELDPDAYVYYNNLSGILRQAGRPQEGLRVASEGLRLHPTNRAGRRVSALTLIDLGRIDEAEHLLRESIGDRGPMVQDDRDFAMIDLQRGRFDAAALGFERALAQRGHGWRPDIVRQYIKAGLVAPALEHLEEMFRAEPACAHWLLTTTSPFWAIIRANPESRALMERYAAREASP